MWRAIVEPAAKPFASVDQMIVLNGAQGLSEALAAALSQGVAARQLPRNLLAGGGTRWPHGPAPPGRRRQRAAHRPRRRGRGPRVAAGAGRRPQGPPGLEEGTMLVAVTGASGLIGSALARRLG